MISAKIVFNAIIALLILIYSCYFVGRYAQFSLTVDNQSLAIQRLTNQAIRNSKIDIIALENNTIRAPNRTPGCSFLFFEELWRDCKTIIAGTIQKEAEFDDIRELIALISPIIKLPCSYANNIKTIESVDIMKELKCGESKQRYKASVYYILDKRPVLFETINGEIN